MIKRSVLPSAITSTARNSGPGKMWQSGQVRTLARYCNFKRWSWSSPYSAAAPRAAGDSGGASSVGGVFALKTATGGQGAPLESASSGGRRRAVDVRPARR
ncbi:hypothetical protein EVAR_21001_1 [Eumeta japonica]|uniref:Uncharacterized protein n=1 Tax=Eumeta variegata TaxID=151549 RepID=A0A4C1V5X5_EUMVA|nr:hypothetical protein EVAR_21001_1 [Eumeta japonica]